jgi:hypothetical protein
MKLRLMTTTTTMMGLTPPPHGTGTTTHDVVQQKKVEFQTKRFDLKLYDTKFHAFLKKLHELQKTVRAFDETSAEKAALYGKVRAWRAGGVWHLIDV